jgi:hypothetical protein
MEISVYNQLKKETARLNAVKEKMIYYLGLGWEDAPHSWSSQGVVSDSGHLLNHLIEKFSQCQDNVKFHVSLL